MQTPDLTGIRAAARSFIDAAIAVLRHLHVLPVPAFHRHIRVGHDYFGPDLMFLPEFKHLEHKLTSNYPHRFEKPLHDHSLEFANSYIFSLLEACVARLTESGLPFDSSSRPVDTSIDELLSVLSAKDHEVACCRVVSHLSTIDRQAADVAGVSVVPVEEKRDMFEHLAAVMPGVFRAFGRDEPFVYEPPESILVVRDRGSDPYELSERLSASIDRFLLLVRLLSASTTESLFEVRGETQLVRHMDPALFEFRKTRWPLIRRTAWLQAADSEAITRLGDLLDRLGVERTDVVVTSFDTALRKFNSVQLGEPWYEQLVDLVTALEAILSGQDKEDVVLRVRSRAAALLATQGDPAANIFKDVGKLYGLRSTLIHGGTLRIKDARRVFGTLSTARPEVRGGIEVAQGIDRLRDLVRRSILARIALAQEEALWPLKSQTPVIDEVLADDSERDRWRSTWRSRISSIGAGPAVERAATAVEALSDESPPKGTDARP